jgi:hypothetical protein
MAYNVDEVRGLLKQASDQLGVSQEVIGELAGQVQDLQHKLQARDLVIKLASTGAVPNVELSEKVAEFEQKTDEDLVLEEKVASHTMGLSHSLHTGGVAQGTTGIMDFLNPRS